MDFRSVIEQGNQKEPSESNPKNIVINDEAFKRIPNSKDPLESRIKNGFFKIPNEKNPGLRVQEWIPTNEQPFRK